MTDLYQEHILEAAQQPTFYGEMADADVVIDYSNASCGDDVKLYVKVIQDETTGEQIITKIHWEGQGCIMSQAATELLAADINESRVTVAELLTKQLSDMLQLLGLTEITPGRQSCVMMSLNALQTELASSEKKGVV